MQVIYKHTHIDICILVLYMRIHSILRLCVCIYIFQVCYYKTTNRILKHSKKHLIWYYFDFFILKPFMIFKYCTKIEIIIILFIFIVALAYNIIISGPYKCYINADTLCISFFLTILTIGWFNIFCNSSWHYGFLLVLFIVLAISWITINIYWRWNSFA